jgi:hypothetical protein
VGSTEGALSALSLLRTSIATQDEMARMLVNYHDSTPSSLAATTAPATPILISSSQRADGNPTDSALNSEDNTLHIGATDQKEQGEEDEVADVSLCANSIARNAVSFRNEKVTMRVIIDLIQDALKCYSTTYKEDQVLFNRAEEAEGDEPDSDNKDADGGQICDGEELADADRGGKIEPVEEMNKALFDAQSKKKQGKKFPKMSHNMRNALVCRMGEKKVLEHYESMAATALAYIASIERPQEISTIDSSISDSGLSDGSDSDSDGMKDKLAKCNELLFESLSAR